MRCVLIFAGLFGAAISSAFAAETDWRVGGEAGIEAVADLGFDHDNIRSTNPFRVEDTRYVYELFAGVTYETAHANFDLEYQFDQHDYEEYDVLHRERHQVTASMSSSPLPGTDLSLRYRFRRSQPEGQLGTIDYNQLRARLRLPALSNGSDSLSLRPYVTAEWNIADFKAKDALDGRGWSGTGGFQLTPSASQWRSDLSMAYGQREAQYFHFTYDYIDTIAEFSRPLGLFGAEADIELSYREEWYEGPSGDGGVHRHDREIGAVLDLTRPIGNHFELISRFEIEDHSSTWSAQDYLERSALIGIRAEF